MEKTASRHIPILVKPIVDALVEPLRSLPPNMQATLIDCTLGGGGHTQALLQKLTEEASLSHHKVISFDQDARAIEAAQVRFASEIANGRLAVIHAPFSQVLEKLAEVEAAAEAANIQGTTTSTHAANSQPHTAPAPAPSTLAVMGLMADLGFSSDQIDDPARGLSFQGDGPLDMRMDPSRGLPCSDFLKQVSESDLVEILRNYGEEPFAGRIARTLIEARRDNHSPKTTQELREIVVKATPPKFRHGRIHVATRTFQALRIAVNREMEELDTLLNHVILGVKPGGRVAILSFHSLEDRKVKQTFKSSEPTAAFEQLTKKPLVADEEELAVNPRSRSAKLRIATRLEVASQ